MNNRRELLKTALLGAGALLAPGWLLAAQDTGGQKSPNFIFILTDDQGWGDAGAFGHPYMKTPNIDRLVSESTRFTQFYVSNPVCSPSRAAFMTGHYPARHRVHQHFASFESNKKRGMPNALDTNVTTVCDILKDAGYATAHYGKWHLGQGNGVEPPSAYGIATHRTFNTPGWPGWDEKLDPFFRAHSTGLFVDDTIAFIRTCVAQKRPFYVNLWTLVPHATLKPTPEELAVYDNLKVDPADFGSYMRDYVRDTTNITAQMKVFCAAMTGMDKALGRLFQFLDEAHLAENTVIFMSSDNGPEDYHIGIDSMGSPGPLRARKRSIYEGGVRTPMLVRWTGRIKAGRSDSESVLGAVDLLPTVCGLAGVKLPDIRPDGEDVSDILLGTARPRRSPLFWEWRGSVSGNPAYRPPALAVRDGKWKYLMNPDGTGGELYNIPDDPEERNNVVAQNAGLAESLAAKLRDWKATLPQ